MLRKLGTAVYRTRWLVVVASLFILVAMAWYGSGLFGSLKSGGFSDPASESTKAQNLLTTQLGGSTADVIILMSSDTLKVTDGAFMDAAQKVLSPLQARPEVAAISSYYSTHSPHFLSRN